MGIQEILVQSHLRFSMLLCISNSVSHTLSFIICKMKLKLFLLSNPCSWQLLLEVLQSGSSKWDFCLDRKSLFMTKKMNHLPHWIFTLQVPSKCYDCGKIKNKINFFFQFWNVAVSECLSLLYVLILGHGIHLGLRGLCFPWFTIKLVWHIVWLIQECYEALCSHSMSHFLTSLFRL